MNLISTPPASQPAEALFGGEKAFPVLCTCEHFAGSEKLILKAMDLQKDLGPIFDITCDCEDGAPAGNERQHAELVASLINSERNAFARAGVRIHDPSHPCWQQDVDLVVGQAAGRLAYLTVPKATHLGQVTLVIDYVQRVASQAGAKQGIPVHVLIETHGALQDVFGIAALPHVEVLDFGQMDFVSGHRGVIPASAMRSPGQFEHALLVRAKADIVAAAVRNGVVAAHNVCLSLKDENAVYADALRARTQFGFLRMWSIHPAQIRPIVEAMKPPCDEVQDASNILIAAQDAYWGPIQYKGELHDRATYRYFWSILLRAKATGIALPTNAQDRFFNS
jgi:citrate lyase subunit beta/citryl-CoA lyase